MSHGSEFELKRFGFQASSMDMFSCRNADVWVLHLACASEKRGAALRTTNWCSMLGKLKQQPLSRKLMKSDNILWAICDGA